MSDIELAGRPKEIKAFLELRKPTLTQLCGPYLTPDRLIASAIVAAVKNPKLQECTQTSWYEALTRAARMGLTVDGSGNQGSLVPYGQTVTFIPGYGGLETLAHRSGKLEFIHSEVVMAGDEFSRTAGDSPSLKHTPVHKTPRTYANLTGAYVVWRPAGSAVTLHEYMTRAEIDRIKAKSRSDAWRDEWWAVEMARKCPIRRAAKHWPTTDALAEAISIIDQHEVGPEGGFPSREEREEQRNADLARRVGLPGASARASGAGAVDAPTAAPAPAHVPDSPLADADFVDSLDFDAKG